MVTKVFQLLLLLSPICVGLNTDMDMFDIIFFRTGVIALFMASMIDTRKREMPKEVNYMAIGLLGICLFNSFVHTFQPIILHNFLNLFLAVVGFYIVYQYLDTSKNIVNYILAAGAINLIFALSQSIGFDPVYNEKFQKVGAFMGNMPRLANYFTLLIPFLAFPLVLASILLVWFSDQFVLLIPIALIVFLKVKSLRDRILMGILAFLIMLIFRKHIYQSLIITRFNTFWKPGLEAFFDRPLIGYGLGGQVVKDAGSLFNSYLQFIVAVGIAGAVWFGYVFKNTYKKIGRNKESVGFITLALLGLIEYPVEIPRLWFLEIAIITMFLLKPEVI